jgi:hypothetical protein
MHFPYLLPAYAIALADEKRFAVTFKISDLSIQRQRICIYKLPPSKAVYYWQSWYPTCEVADSLRLSISCDWCFSVFFARMQYFNNEETRGYRAPRPVPQISHPLTVKKTV